jgi:glyoxylase-like metal-dependent hydrolase (beta-lactamase superfamily II)
MVIALRRQLRETQSCNQKQDRTLTMPLMLTRRFALLAGAAAPLVTVLGSGPAQAAAEMKGSSTPDHYRFKLGSFEVTALRAGTAIGENPQQTFGMNVTPEEFAAVSEANFIPSDKNANSFNPSLVNTGSELILFDTGMNPGAITSALAAAGYTPDQIDIVVITHMHGDHIGGLAGEGGPTFPNARYVTGAIEHNHWSGTDNEGFARNVRPLEDKMTFLDEGGSVVSGITAMPAYGHTPGQFAYMLESDGQQLAITADTANHAIWSVQNPDWEVRFDMDKPTAAATRRRILGMLATDRVPFLAYHLSFPGIGYVEAAGDGFRHVPLRYQMLLNG